MMHIKLLMKNIRNAVYFPHFLCCNCTRNVLRGSQDMYNSFELPKIEQAFTDCRNLAYTQTLGSTLPTQL